MEATRELFWNTNGRGLMYHCSLIVLVIFAVGLIRKMQGWRQGHPFKCDNLSSRFKTFFLDLILHNKEIFKGTFRRFMHLSIFYGFIILFIGTSMIALQVDFKIPLFLGIKYLIIKLLMDLFGLLALIGIVMAVYKRYIAKRDHADYSLDDAIMLIWVILILFTGFILEGLRLYVTKDIWAKWTPVGFLMAAAIQKCGITVQSARSFHAALWYLHMLLAFGFIAYLPYFKLIHILASPLNLLFKSPTPIGALTPVTIVSEEANNFGVRRLGDFSRKQLVELDACVSCLRCQKGCPAFMIGEPLSPRRLIQTLKKHANKQYSFFRGNRKSFTPLIIGQVISRETLWACTTCGLCEDKCPIRIEHIKRIVDLRRALASENEGYLPEVQNIFRNIRETGNPWRMKLDADCDWASEGRGPFLSERKQSDVLYWVGCFSSYQFRNKMVPQIMVKLFQRAEVDYALLGREEKCCGDSVRRLGNEKLFQQLAFENVSLLNHYKFKTIVTHCAHCYNTLKNDYPQFGGYFHVMHHSEFLYELIKSGKLKLKAVNNLKVTYHDPCYLGRYNNIYQAPRDVLTSIPGIELVEMKNNQARGFCCGGGGGQIWLPNTKVESINSLLVKKALVTKPDILASACSLCLAMLSEAISSSNAKIESMDIAEIIYKAL